jgi:hypothetical protein
LLGTNIHVWEIHIIHHLILIIILLLLIWTLIFSRMLSLSLVHVIKIIKNPFIFYWFFTELLQHFLRSWAIYNFAIFRIYNLLIFCTHQSIKMIEIYIFNISPLYFEIIFKFVIKIVPPIWKNLLNKIWSHFSNSFKHTTLNNAKE